MNGCTTRGLVLADACAVSLRRKVLTMRITGTEGVNPILVITEGERDFAVMAHESMEKLPYSGDGHHQRCVGYFPGLPIPGRGLWRSERITTPPEMPTPKPSVNPCPTMR